MCYAIFIEYNHKQETKLKLYNDYMAKLHFFYSTMNAANLLLLQSNHNYLESDSKTMLFIPEELKEISDSKIVSELD